MTRNVSGKWIRLTAALLGACVAGRLRATGEDGVFGSQQRNTSAIIGIFYDLKQDQRREPTKGVNFHRVVDDFVVSGFDEALLNKFFRAPLPLYTTQIYIPRMSAEQAPKAFGVEDEVKPRMWVVHYKAQIAPPGDGDYRFVGHADDLMVVAINGKVVLNASLGSTSGRMVKTNWKSAEKGPPPAADNAAIYGDWISLKADRPVDLDILIGEWPGGVFKALLFYEKRGEAYPRAGGKIVLPLFQVAGKKMENREFLTDGPVWKCFE